VPEVKKRKGAVRIADIPADIRKKLNRGEIEALTLAECLAVDFAQLMKNGIPGVQASTLKTITAAAKTGWVGRTKLAGQILLEDVGLDALPDMLAHASDQVRGWAASMVAAHEKMPLKKRLTMIRPLADDPNPGVRETVWIVLRPHVAEDIGHSLGLLEEWVYDEKPNIRRFASEITRPRGVWCAYLPAMREKPQLGLPLLEPLRADPSRYVQNSVANWLNDASKDKPDWVLKTTKKWQTKNTPKETAYIIRRALRTIHKSG
jgi:3-methyladenine DNA glycosylase AlkC